MFKRLMQCFPYSSAGVNASLTQRIRSHRDVWILLFGQFGAFDSSFSLVEKLPHQAATCKFSLLLYVK